MFSYVQILLPLIIIYSKSETDLKQTATRDNYTQVFFSVVVTIYNTAQYLEECLNSVVFQTIGFEENIQLILINDGSQDESEKICSRYIKQFPNNIMYIKQSNKGPSAARNAGIPYVTGQFINFLDSDDKWQLDAFQQVYDFIQQHNNNTDVIACRVQFFEARTSFHMLDYKFKKSRIANLLTEYDCIQLQTTSAFIRTSAIGQLRFIENLTVSEDFRFVNTILLKRCTLGIVREAKYFYRKRSINNSLIQTSLRNQGYYFITPIHVYQFLMNLSQSKYGRILGFIQYSVMYDLQWRIRAPAVENANRQDEYVAIIMNLLKQIDDNIILQQRYFNTLLKLLALERKYGEDIQKLLVNNASNFYFHNNYICSIPKAVQSSLCWHYIRVSNDNLVLISQDNFILHPAEYSYYATVNGKKHYPISQRYSKLDYNTIIGCAKIGRMIIFNIPLAKQKIQYIKFYLKYKSLDMQLNPRIGLYSIVSELDHSYTIRGTFIISHRNGTLIIMPYKVLNHFLLEYNYCKQLRSVGKDNLLPYRRRYWGRFLSTLQRIWLVITYANSIDENLETLYRYFASKKNLNLQIYCCMKQSNTDYQRLKQFGSVVDLSSQLFRTLYQIADKIIVSSFSDIATIDDDRDRHYLIDLTHSDRVYIHPHMIVDTLSNAVHYLGSFQQVIVGSFPELRIVQETPLCFQRDCIILSGYPRNDIIYRMNAGIEKHDSVLIFMSSSSEMPYREVSSSNDQSQAYNSQDAVLKDLVNSSELMSLLKRKNYTVRFCIPNDKQPPQFSFNKVFSVSSCSADYLYAIGAAFLLITDNITVATDFLFLRKQVIYYSSTYSESSLGRFSQFIIYCSDLDCIINKTLIFLETSNRSDSIDDIDTVFPYFDDHNIERVAQFLLGSDSNWNSYCSTRELLVYELEKMVLVILSLIGFSIFLCKKKKKRADLYRSYIPIAKTD